MKNIAFDEIKYDQKMADLESKKTCRKAATRQRSVSNSEKSHSISKTPLEAMLFDSAVSLTDRSKNLDHSPESVFRPSTMIRSISMYEIDDLKLWTPTITPKPISFDRSIKAPSVFRRYLNASAFIPFTEFPIEETPVNPIIDLAPAVPEQVSPLSVFKPTTMTRSISMYDFDDIKLWTPTVPEKIQIFDRSIKAPSIFRRYLKAPIFVPQFNIPRETVNSTASTTNLASVLQQSEMTCSDSDNTKIRAPKLPESIIDFDKSIKAPSIFLRYLNAPVFVPHIETAPEPIATSNSAPMQPQPILPAFITHEEPAPDIITTQPDPRVDLTTTPIEISIIAPTQPTPIISAFITQEEPAPRTATQPQLLLSESKEPTVSHCLTMYNLTDQNLLTPPITPTEVFVRPPESPSLLHHSLKTSNLHPAIEPLELPDKLPRSLSMYEFGDIFLFKPNLSNHARVPLGIRRILKAPSFEIFKFPVEGETRGWGGFLDGLDTVVQYESGNNLKT